MIVAPGTVQLSIDVFYADDTGAAVTGKVAADFPACKWSGGSNTADTTITLSDLALITTAHPNDNTAGGIKEREGGWYRLDCPNNMVSAAGRKTLTFAEAAGKRIIAPPIDCQYVQGDVEKWLGATAPANTGDAFARIGTAGSGLTAIGDSRIANLDVATSTRSTYAGTDTAGTGTLLTRVPALLPVAADYSAARAAKLDNLDATVSSRLASGSYTAPDNASAAAAAAFASSADGKATTILSRIGAFTGTGLNTILGFLRGMANKFAGLTPSDLTSGGGTFDNTTDSLEKISESSGGGGGGGDPWATDVVSGGYTGDQAGALLASLNGANISVFFLGTVDQNGNLTIIIGDDHFAADGRQFDITDVLGTWADLTAATAVNLWLFNNGAIALGPIAGTFVVRGGSSQKVRFELDRTQTLTLAALPRANLPPYSYQVRAVLASGHYETLQFGQARALPGAG
jgi:hypothetical protein